MDSIHHLSTSLPHTRRRQDNSELLADFKAAALSVTNLYKTAAASQDRARASGYQDALDDLLTFLDHENLGLMDGEGWRVRQWATERLVDDGVERRRSGSVSDEEVEAARDEQQTHTQTRSSSPEMQRKPAVPNSSSDVHEEGDERKRSAVSEPPSRQTPPPATATNAQTQIQPPALDAFTFRTQHSYPTNHDRESNMDLDASTTSSSTPSSTESVRFLPVPRPVRGRAHAANHVRRSGNGNASTTIGVNLGAGSKRKLPYPDFFDISNINLDGYDWKDGADRGGGRGGKRGRFA